jgi:large subunit ribosomal protein L10
MLKQQKVDLVTNLTPVLANAKSIILVNYTGLSVASQQALKLKLKEVGASMTVVKNTLIKRAAESAKLDSQIATDEILSGQTALVTTEGDAVAPIQVLGKFAKENNVPQFKVGIVDGNFQDTASLSKISLLPTKDVLYSQVVGTIAGPMYGLVGTLNANMQKLLFILTEKSKS